MTCCAVIDTNVLVSALLSKRDDTATVQVVEHLLSGEIIPVFSEEILAEYRDVLMRPKFGFDRGTIDYLLSAVEQFGILLSPSTAEVVLSDMKDLPFYEVALEIRDDSGYLVTGNLKHFPKEDFIVTPREMIEILNS